MLYLGMDRNPDKLDLPLVRGSLIEWIEEYGFAVPIEKWARWVCIDRNGKIHIFQNTPTPYEHGFNEWMAVNSGRVRCAGECDLDGKDWRDTLVKLRHSQ